MTLKNRPELTAERLRELLSYDPDTGIFRWLVRTTNSTKVGDIAGGVTARGYVQIRVSGRAYYAHRLAWLYVYGRWPDDQLDHITGVKTFNSIANLREATMAENQQNRALSRSSTSGFLGVSWFKQTQKWEAHIKINGRKIHIGYFDDAEAAYQAYKSAKRNVHTFQPVVRSASS